MMLGAIVASMLFLVKRSGEVLNVKHDDYFLNKHLFSKVDSDKILRQKFFAYVKISLVIKVLLVIAMLLFNEHNLSLFSIGTIFLLLAILVVNEWNSLYVAGRINFLLQHTVRYMLSIGAFVLIYWDKPLSLFLLLAIFGFKEYYILKQRIQSIV